MSKLPYWKFYADDYIAGDIQTHDMETQGIFINICALAWRKGGAIDMNIDRLSRHLRVDKQTLSERLTALLDDDCLVKTDDGKITTEFMLIQMDELTTRSEQCAEAGRKGGKAKALHTRSKRLASAKQTSSERQADAKQTSSKLEPEPEVEVDSSKRATKEQIELWNGIADQHGLNKIKSITGQRLKHYQARLKDSPDFWAVVQLEIPRLGTFACGDNDRGWKIDFDFLVQSKNNFDKFGEGKYRTKGAVAKPEIDHSWAGYAPVPTIERD